MCSVALSFECSRGIHWPVWRALGSPLLQDIFARCFAGIGAIIQECTCSGVGLLAASPFDAAAGRTVIGSRETCYPPREWIYGAEKNNRNAEQPGKREHSNIITYTVIIITAAAADGKAARRWRRQQPWPSAIIRLFPFFLPFPLSRRILCVRLSAFSTSLLLLW